VAGDRVFSIKIALTEVQEGTVYLRVSADSIGLLRRVYSSAAMVAAVKADDWRWFSTHAMSKRGIFASASLVATVRPRTANAVPAGQDA